VVFRGPSGRHRTAPHPVAHRREASRGLEQPACRPCEGGLRHEWRGRCHSSRAVGVVIRAQFHSAGPGTRHERHCVLVVGAVGRWFTVTVAVTIVCRYHQFRSHEERCPVEAAGWHRPATGARREGELKVDGWKFSAEQLVAIFHGKFDRGDYFFADASRSCWLQLAAGHDSRVVMGNLQCCGLRGAETPPTGTDNWAGVDRCSHDVSGGLGT